MSFAATTWAWRQEGLSAGEKFVLLALAEGASSEDGECWHSQAFLARMTSLSRATVSKHVQALVERGLILSAERYRPDGSRTSNLYRLPSEATLYGIQTPPVKNLDTPLSGILTAEPVSSKPVREPGTTPSQIPLHPPPQSGKVPAARAREKSTFEAAEREGFEFVVRGKEPLWKPPDALLKALAQAYPDLDIGAEVRLAAAKIATGAVKAKTPTGMPACLWAWMKAAQEKPWIRAGGGGQQQRAHAPSGLPDISPGCPRVAYFEYVPKATWDGSAYYSREEWDHPEKRPRGAPTHGFGPWPGPEEETRR